MKLIEKLLRARESSAFLRMIEFATKDECWMWSGTKDRYGYGIFGRSRAHRVMAKMVGKRIDGKQVRHTCDNPPCCNPFHLRTGTHTQNMQDRSKRNRTAKGCRNGRSKLTDSQVLEIRASDGTAREIGARFGMDFSSIADIRARRTWKHL